MTNKIQILDATSQSIIGEIEVEDAYINERINDTYTFDFSCYEQTNTNLLAQETLIYVDNDYFRIANIEISPVEGRYDVSCEHISYELNVITPEEDEEEAEELVYEGKIWDIMNEILEGTNFVYFHSDDINDNFDFVTRQKGKRARILEFCVQNELEVHWFRYQVSIQKRRGADNGLIIELGENLRDLKIKKRFQFNGEIETVYDIDFIDLNKIKDTNGNPLKPNEFHMGDTVHLRYKGKTVEQRGKAVGYNPFKRALPTIELENLVRDITEVIADNAVSSGSSSTGEGGVMETTMGAFYNGIEFRFTKPYDELFSLMIIPMYGQIEYEIIQNADDKFIGAKVFAVNSEPVGTLSLQAVVK